MKTTSQDLATQHSAARRFRVFATAACSAGTALPRGRRGPRYVALTWVLALVVGCSQTVLLRTTSPADVTLNGESVGRVTPEGIEVEIPLGIDPVPYAISDETRTRTGEIVRGPVSWWIDGSIIGVSGVTAATCGACGCLAANPTCVGSAAGLVFPPLLLTSTFVTSGVFATAPGWLTAPLTCAGCAAGSTPLLSLYGMPRLTPDEIELSLVEPPAPDTLITAPPAAAQ